VWPSGQAWVCKTFYGGSNPPATSDLKWQAIVIRAVFLYGLCFFNYLSVMSWLHQNKFRLWARIALVVLLLSLVRQFIVILQYQYQLTTPFIPQNTVLQIIRPLLITGLITTIASLVILLFYFFEKYVWVILWTAIALIGPHFYPYFFY
jgi:hypothetical protein